MRLAASSLLCLETTVVGVQLDELGAVRTGRSTALASGPIINAYDEGAFEWDSSVKLDRGNGCFSARLGIGRASAGSAPLAAIGGASGQGQGRVELRPWVRLAPIAKWRREPSFPASLSNPRFAPKRTLIASRGTKAASSLRRIRKTAAIPSPVRRFPASEGRRR